MDAHIQMPKLILKNFVDIYGAFFYFDFSDGRVKKGHPKTFYTEENYYSENVEKFLGSVVESPLGRLVAYLKETSFEPNECPPQNYVEVARMYLLSLIGRSPKFAEEEPHGTIYYQFTNGFSNYQKRNLAASTVIMREFFEGKRRFKISFMDNTTSETLVLPTGGLTQYGAVVISPVTPFRAIVFEPILSEQEETEYDRNVIDLYCISETKTVHEINIESIRQEAKRDRKYVVAKTREYIQCLRDEVFKDT